jgi:hypothetical protein
MSSIDAQFSRRGEILGIWRAVYEVEGWIDEIGAWECWSVTELIAFPTHALLILEERLRERQEAGELPPEMDPTDLALRL